MISTSLNKGRFNQEGTRKIVEVDNILFYKRKYNRGCKTDGKCYVSGIEGGPKRSFCTFIK